MSTSFSSVFFSYFFFFILLSCCAVVVYFLLRRYAHLVPYFICYARLQYYIRIFIWRRHTAIDLFEARVRNSPNAVAVLFEGKQYTFAQVDQQANLIAAWADERGFKPRDVVALIMENRAEYLFVWLGLSKLGIISALINNQLKGSPLVHSLTCTAVRAVIVGSECLAQVSEISSSLPSELPLFSYGPSTMAGFTDLQPMLNSPLSKASFVDFSSIRRQYKLCSTDAIFYIFTSGTTGLPKASKITHSRFALAATSFSIFNGISNNDVVYVCMPLYHAAAGMIGTGFFLFTGCKLVLKRKFSASAFFKDCCDYKVTVIQYVGQIARYLLNTPISPYDQAHSIQKAIGNGMGDAWIPFQKRFHIPYIGEFYASTEGNANLLNNQNKPLAIGYLPWIATLFYPLRIVRFDHEHEIPIRNSRTGFCTDISPGECGELIGRVSNSDPLSKFEGYTNKKATEDKLLRNVFKSDDCWFRSGDLVTKDSDGFIYFIDRIGDTFRWRGENVSTVEVERILMEVAGIKEVNVYGVPVPKNDGKAGMAALVVDLDDGSSSVFDFSNLYDHIRKNMANYQQPLFLRLKKEMEITGTFKLRKVELVKDGFDPEKIIDEKIYFRDDNRKEFIPMTKELYKNICEGKIRF